MPLAPKARLLRAFQAEVQSAISRPRRLYGRAKLKDSSCLWQWKTDKIRYRPAPTLGCLPMNPRRTFRSRWDGCLNEHRCRCRDLRCERNSWMKERADGEG